jgi:hypothetical protein
MAQDNYARVFATVKHFKPSLTFADKAKAYQSRARYNAQLIVQGSSLAHKYYTRAIKVHRNKHPSFFKHVYDHHDDCKSDTTIWSFTLGA